MSTKKSEGAKAALVRIAIADISSELSFECESSPAEIKTAVAKALSDNSLLTLTDIRGHEIVVAAEKIGFVDIGVAADRRVGFGAV